MIEPITPQEVLATKASALPDEVIKCWNNLIARKFSAGEARVIQEDIIDDLMKAMNCKRSVVFENNWLDVEDIYETKGWKVHYDKPGYDESYRAFFTFTLL